MDGFILVVFLGLLPAAIAHRKGKNFIMWWFYGAMLLIVALPHALLMNGHMKKCPQCAEQVKLDALVCRYCGNKFDIEADIREVAALKSKKKGIKLY